MVKMARRSSEDLLINLQKIFLRSHVDLRKIFIEDLEKNSRLDLFNIASTISFISSAWIIKRFLKDLSDILSEIL